MGISSSCMERVTAISRKAGIARIFCFVCLLFVGSVHAQVIVDAPSTDYTQNLQWLKQIDQALQEVKTYESTLMTVEGLGSSLLQTPMNLQRITDANSLIQQNCPGAPGLTGMISSLTGINLGDKILASQASICANITLVEIDQYNRTVDIVNQMQGYAATAQKLNQLTAIYHNPGDIAAILQQTTTFNTTINKTMQDWSTAMKADEELVEALQKQQQILSRVALKGNSVVGNLVQVGVLAGALAIKD